MWIFDNLTLIGNALASPGGDMTAGEMIFAEKKQLHEPF